MKAPPNPTIKKVLDAVMGLEDLKFAPPWIAYIDPNGNQIGARQEGRGIEIDLQGNIVFPILAEDKSNVQRIEAWSAAEKGDLFLWWNFSRTVSLRKGNLAKVWPPIG